ncbi:hypothetical protein BJ322DRAFT_1008802 [Thelephora terrestris]|uniref:DUF6535 domain-containing protein n=1 Tax=Thelephora terrestris TaxID=56493 RepID=A0A9P6HAF1_9AGAM|nr:hypothetical protein BJ322DRAFT_1008802 [Thelephora terrestris]
MTNFWTIYQKATSEYESDLLNRYAGDLDTSLLFAGLFSAVSTAFIVQIIPATQPNPSDITNALLLRLLQHNDSFGGSNPLAPAANVSPSVVRAQSILFASLAATLFVAFLSVLGKQWILHYPRTSTLGSVIDQGKERQAKFAGVQKWGLHYIISLLLQLALLLFTIGIVVYLWDLDFSAAEVMIAIACTGFAFYACIAVVATIWNDSPFQTPLSVFLLKVLRQTKEVAAYVRARLGRLQTEWTAWRKNIPVEDVYDQFYSMTLSNPTFWRKDPLFTSPFPEATDAAAGFPESDRRRVWS